MSKYPLKGTVQLVHPKFAIILESNTQQFNILPKELMPDNIEIGDAFEYSLIHPDAKEIYKAKFIEESNGVKRGLDVEKKEHGDMTKKIAKDHLKEDPDYYDDWENKEKILKKKKVPKACKEDHMPNEYEGTFIIKDWAGNQINDMKGHEMTFPSFEDAWQYIYDLHPDDEGMLGEYEVIEIPSKLPRQTEESLNEEDDFEYDDLQKNLTKPEFTVHEWDLFEPARSRRDAMDYTQFLKIMRNPDEIYDQNVDYEMDAVDNEEESVMRDQEVPEEYREDVREEVQNKMSYNIEVLFPSNVLFYSAPSGDPEYYGQESSEGTEAELARLTEQVIAAGGSAEDAKELYDNSYSGGNFFVGVTPGGEEMKAFMFTDENSDVTLSGEGYLMLIDLYNGAGHLISLANPVNLVGKKKDFAIDGEYRYSVEDIFGMGFAS